jgi:hypothetical protein
VNCRVDQDLSDYEHNNDKLEREWELTKEDKIDELVDLTLTVLMNEADHELFKRCFGNSFNLEYADENTFLNDCLSNLNNEDFYSAKLILLALENCCKYLHGCDLTDLEEDITLLIDRVFEMV